MIFIFRMSNKRKSQASILGFFNKRVNLDSGGGGQGASPLARADGEALTSPQQYNDDGHGASQVASGGQEAVSHLGSDVVSDQGDALNGEQVIAAAEKQVEWANSREVMSISEICRNVHKWYDPKYAEDTSGSRSTMFSKKQDISPKFKTDFPDVLFIKVSDILKFSM